MAKAVKKLTAKDKVVLAVIVKNGHIRRDLNGQFWTETDFPTTGWRISRLEALGFVAPNADALIPGEPPQTWSATEAGRNAV